MMCVFYYVALLFFAFIHSRTRTRVNTEHTKGDKFRWGKRKKLIVTLFNRTIVERTTKRSQSARKHTHTKRSRRAAPRERS